MPKPVLSHPRMYHEFRNMSSSAFRYYDEKTASKLASGLGKKAVTEMAFNLTKLGLVEKGNLLRSLKFSVKKSEFKEVSAVQFKYEFYGKFFENGAHNVFGKGITLNPKPWRNIVLNPMWEEINQEFSKYYASIIQQEIVEDATKILNTEIKVQM